MAKYHRETSEQKPEEFLCLNFACGLPPKSKGDPSSAAGDSILRDIKGRFKAYLSENGRVEGKKSSAQKWLKKNRAMKTRYQNLWKLKNKDKVKIWRIKNHAMRRGAGYISIGIIQQVYEDNIKKHGTLTCYLCELPILFGKDHLEHKTPLSRGGTNEKNNLDISCPKCNLTKGIKTEKEFISIRLPSRTLNFRGHYGLA